MYSLSIQEIPSSSLEIQSQMATISLTSVGRSLKLTITEEALLGILPSLPLELHSRQWSFYERSSRSNMLSFGVGVDIDD